MKCPPSGEVIDAMRAARAAGATIEEISRQFGMGCSAASRHTSGFAPVPEDIPDLKVRRRCKDALPVLPALVEGQPAAERALSMLAFTLSGVSTASN